MFDNPMHRLLCAAADQAGWDEETMLLQATRFLEHLAGDRPEVAVRFQDYLAEQVAFDVFTATDPSEPSLACGPCAATVGLGQAEAGSGSAKHAA